MPSPGNPEDPNKGPQGSPTGSSSDMAKNSLSVIIENVEAECLRIRRVVSALRMSYEALSREVEPEVEPDQETVEPEPEASLKLVELGIELAGREKDLIRMEKDVIAKKLKAGGLLPQAAGNQMRNLNRRYFLAGDELWRNEKKKLRLDDPGTVRLFEPRGNGLSECLLALYVRGDGQNQPKKRPHWHQKVLAYYGGAHPDGMQEWCHVTGMYWPGGKPGKPGKPGVKPMSDIKAAHIVPFFNNNQDIAEMVFGSRAESLEREGNSLLLSHHIESWYATYHLVIVPVDATETPITRWRVDIISDDIRKTTYLPGRFASELDGKELMFLNDKRPVSRFMYFHFVMSLVRAKDQKRYGWEDAWARYYTQRPFPAPGNYMRKSMLLAIATHFETTDMHMIESWIADHGFDTPLRLTSDEATEAARRVHEAVEAAVCQAEEAGEDESDEESDGQSSDSDSDSDEV